MSGPKKADVEAKLSMVEQNKNRCKALIADAKNEANDKGVKEIKDVLEKAQKILDGCAVDMKNTSSEQRRVNTETIAQAEKKIQEAKGTVRKASGFFEETKGLIEQSKKLSRETKELFDKAVGAYDQAWKKLRSSSGAHYRREEMDQALQAERYFEKARAVGTRAAQAGQEAQQAVAKALKAVKDADHQLLAAANHLRTAVAEADVKLQAEQEAQRILEEKRRQAVVALGDLRAFAARFEKRRHEKFIPGQVKELQQALQLLEKAYNGEDYDAVLAKSPRLLEEFSQNQSRLDELEQAFEEEKAAAETECSRFAALLASVDRKLIQEWSAQTAAMGAVVQAANEMEELLKQEAFAKAVDLACTSLGTLEQILGEAAANKAADEQRTKIGEAIMDVLDEMGFDVSFAEGSLQQDLMIAGQTQDISGKGDFDIKIPLNGEIDFEVSATTGDTACVAAIHSLTQKLEDQGIYWQTTNWGYAEGNAANSNQKQKLVEREKLKVKAKY